MPKVKGLPISQNKGGSWGGKREGAGRKRELKDEDRKRIAKHYAKRMALQTKRPARELVVRELMDEYQVTHRMVERALAEFLSEIRIWAYATKGMKRQPLSAREIEKLKRHVGP
jgi:hypothetical protein